MPMLDDDMIQSLNALFPREDALEEDFLLFLVKILGSGNFAANAACAQDLYQNSELRVRETVLNACKTGRFEDIRKMLGSISHQRSSSQRSIKPLDFQSRMILKSSFEVNYLGKAVDGLYEHLAKNDQLYYSSDKGKENQYYGKFCSIVQSSGTGKSRTMIELRRRDVIVLYMNIRSKSDTKGFPERDHLIANILKNFSPSQQAYSDRCYALFTVIFRVLKYTFKKYLLETSEADELVKRWNKDMCDLGSRVRAWFFETVKVEFDKLWKKLGFSDDDPGTSMTKGEQDMDLDSVIQDGPPPGISPSNSADLAQISSGTTSQDTPEAIPTQNLMSAVNAWNEFAMERLGWKPSCNNPRLVIEFDEAHVLSHIHDDNYRPSTVLCRAISEFSAVKAPIWVLFASTTSQVADFSAPAISHDSLRVSTKGQLLFPPYIHLGWDKNAMDTTQVQPNEVSEFKYIARLGRPLWVSLTNLVASDNAVLDIAREKLCKKNTYDPSDEGQALAVLGARLCLGICFGHTESNEFNTKAVASHMRILKSITADRLWQTTIYPSEPLLACAAAMQLHSSRESLEATLKVLSDNILGRMVETGNRGELVSRGLLLIGKDLFVRSLGLARTLQKYTHNGKLPDCMSVSVVKYLRFMFGAGIIDDDAEKVLDGWNLNFSHWIPMSGDICYIKQGRPARHDFAERHWYRTSAVQCSHNQPQIDKVIPIYNPDSHQPDPRQPDPRQPAPRFSYILISDRARQDPSKEELTKITYEKIFGCNAIEPYVVIMLDMGIRTSAPPETLRPHDPKGPYRIYVKGMDPKSFPFLHKQPQILRYFANIIGVEQTPPDTTSVVSQLDTELDVGTTVADKHMLWDLESGKYEAYRKAKWVGDVWLGKRAS